MSWRVVYDLFLHQLCASFLFLLVVRNGYGCSHYFNIHLIKGPSDRTQTGKKRNNSIDCLKLQNMQMNELGW
jgi:hypothetical protein